MPKEEDEEETDSKDIPLKDKQSTEKNGNVNKAFSGDEQG
jgi:hypothetical protein